MSQGDKLASGATSAKFTANDGTVSQEKWDSIFADYEPVGVMKSQKQEFIEIPPVPQEFLDDCEEFARMVQRETARK